MTKEEVINVREAWESCDLSHLGTLAAQTAALLAPHVKPSDKVMDDLNRIIRGKSSSPASDIVVVVQYLHELESSI